MSMWRLAGSRVGLLAAGSDGGISHSSVARLLALSASVRQFHSVVAQYYARYPCTP